MGIIPAPCAGGRDAMNFRDLTNAELRRAWRDAPAPVQAQLTAILAERMPTRLHIVARKPRNADSDFIVVDRITVGWGGCRFVSATVNEDSLKNNEWYWGHYFQTLDEAMAHFNGRGCDFHF